MNYRGKKKIVYSNGRISNTEETLAGFGFEPLL